MPRVLRCLTLNLWSASPPLEARLALVRRGIEELAPDVVALQEVYQVPGRVPNTAATLAAACGYAHAFASASVPGAQNDWGLAILARDGVAEHAAVDLPSPEAGERRILLSARVAVPGPPLWVHTTHLNYRLHDGLAREQQVQAVDAQVAARAGERPQVVMGDFNARPECDEIRWLRGQATLGGRRVHYQDAWAALRPTEPGWTWASANPYVAHHLEPDRRIDYVFVTSRRRDGRGAIHDCRLVLDRPGDDGVFPSDHFGVYAEVQIDPDEA